MKLSGLLPRQQGSLPGVVGVAKVDRQNGDLPTRVDAGDIVVLDRPDLDRRTAAALVDAQVAAVVNIVSSISGRFPNLGPELLLAEDIVLVDDVGPEFLWQVKDGMRLRVHSGGIFIGAREIGRGQQQDADSIADRLIEAKAGMCAQLEAFSANTIEFLRRERRLVLDGVGVPELSVPMDGRPVLVVGPGDGYLDDLKRLKDYLREHQPIMIGVRSGAESLYEVGYMPTVIVGDPDEINPRTLKCGAEVVIPAHLDGYAPGLERVQDLGIGAVTFPASGNAEDLALLLADAHGASLVITIGYQATLHEFLDQDRSGTNPSTFLTRLKLGNKLIDGAAIPTLRRDRVPVGALFVLILAVLILFCVAVVISGLGDEYVEVLTNASISAGQWFGGLFA